MYHEVEWIVVGQRSISSALLLLIALAKLTANACEVAMSSALNVSHH